MSAKVKDKWVEYQGNLITKFALNHPKLKSCDSLDLIYRYHKNSGLRPKKLGSLDVSKTQINSMFSNMDFVSNVSVEYF